MQLVIGDFGQAAVLHRVGSLQGSEVTSRTSSLKESPCTWVYAAPEVVHKQSYDFKLDVWSAGAILWQMLQEDSRTLPMRLESNPDRAMAAIGLDRFILKIESLRVTESPSITLVTEMLQTLPARRPSAMEALQHPWLAPPSYGIDTPAPRQPMSEVAPLNQAPSQSSVGHPLGPKRRHRRHPYRPREGPPSPCLRRQP